jgi:hypothetical protein
MLTEDDVIKWLEHLETASKSGTFFSAVVGFAVIGRKPKKTE